MNTFVGIMFIFFGLVVIVLSLADKRHVDNADEEPIEGWGPFGKGIYVTRERAYLGIALGFIAGIAFILTGIVFIWI